MASQKIQVGDKVRIKFDSPPDEWGVVVQIYRANPNYERQVLVRHPDAEMGQVWPMRRVELITDTSILPEQYR